MWTWQHPDWPNFRYDAAAVRLQVDEFRLKSERLMGRMEALPADLHTDAVIGLMLSEATAYRDLSALVQMGVLEPLPGGGRNTRYQLRKP
jgi:Fic family protein